jgi:hypothetical protein
MDWIGGGQRCSRSPRAVGEAMDGLGDDGPGWDGMDGGDGELIPGACAESRTGRGINRGLSGRLWCPQGGCAVSGGPGNGCRWVGLSTSVTVRSRTRLFLFFFSGARRAKASFEGGQASLDQELTRKLQVGAPESERMKRYSMSVPAPKSNEVCFFSRV